MTDDTHEDGEVVLSPSRRHASVWALTGAIALLCAAWGLRRAGSAVIVLVAAGVLLACVAVTALFALQVFAPRAWTLHVSRAGVWGHVMGVPVELHRADLGVVRLGRLLGDPVLEVRTDAGRHRYLLPVGADVAGLDRRLAAMTADDAPATAPSPTEPR